LNTAKSTIIAISLAITMAVGMVAAGNIIAQRALADKVGPFPDEDHVKQGGLGEYFSKEGRTDHYGTISGHDFGQVRSGFAKSSPNLIGANTAFYGSGECHYNQPAASPEVCSR
jgi:hypothetical protein